MSQHRQIKATQSADNSHELTIHDHISDSPLLPEPGILKGYEEIRPSTFDWIIVQTEKEGDNRRCYLNRTSWFVFISNLFGQLVSLLGFIVAIFLIQKEQYLSGSLIGSGVLALVLASILKKK